MEKIKSSLLCLYCPRKLDYYPDTPCQLALRTIDAVRQGEDENKEGLCPWYVPNTESNYCYWLMLYREAPVEEPKKIARLLGISKSEVNKLLNSAINKINNKGRRNEDITELHDAIENCTQPLDDSIYLQMFDDSEGFNAEDVWSDYRTSDKDKEDFNQAADIGGRKKKETVVYKTQGFSGSGAMHYKGKRTQVYGLSPKWGKQLKEWSDSGTPIKMAAYSLKKASDNKKESDENNKENK